MLKFTGKQTDETPYFWEYVYRVETLVDSESDYVYSNKPKPPEEGIFRGEYHFDGVVLNVIVATYYVQYPIVSGRMFLV
jgi:hypothetical protein